MNKVTILAIVFILLAGTLFVSAKLIDEKKIKDIKEIDCNKKYDLNCGNKIKIKEGSELKIDLIEDLNTGKEVLKVYAK